VEFLYAGPEDVGRVFFAFLRLLLSQSIEPLFGTVDLFTFQNIRYLFVLLVQCYLIWRRFDFQLHERLLNFVSQSYNAAQQPDQPGSSNK
jgi:hypothetical protein